MREDAASAMAEFIEANDLAENACGLALGAARAHGFLSLPRPDHVSEGRRAGRRIPPLAEKQPGPRIDRGITLTSGELLMRVLRPVATVHRMSEA